MRYPKHLIALDLIGVGGVVSALCYHHFAHNAWNKDEEWFSLWGNLSTEIIGIWLSVRLIDYIIRANEKWHDARLSTVRNMRFLVAEVMRSVEFAGKYETTHLEREFTWAQSMLPKRRRHFSSDELRDIQSFYGILGQELMPKIRELVDLKARVKDGDVTEVTRANAALEPMITRLDESRRKAETNILQETDED